MMEGREILRFLPEPMATSIKKAGPDWDAAEEIRIRAGKPLLFYMNSREYFLKKSGTFTDAAKDRTAGNYEAEPSEIQRILDRVSGHSLYAYQDELRQGYFTLEGGHRIGLTGRTVTEDGKIKTMKYLSFLNIRIAHEKKGCGQEILPKLYDEKGKLRHSLILSPPGCGKTTLLRDFVRLISDGIGVSPMTVGVVDERGEIGASIRGIPTNDLGIRTDLLDGCPKDEGIFLLLRSMAPQVIAVDEIGNRGDFEAIRQAVNSGCVILATAHGSSFSELKEKPLFASFIREHIFSRYILLSGRNGKGTVEKIESMEAKII